MKTFLHSTAESEFRAGRIAACALPLRDRFRASFCALAVLSGLSATSASGQVFVQEILPADPFDGQNFGQSIAANATHFAVGSTFDDNFAGAVYVFKLATGAQVRKVFAPPAEAGSDDQFGAAVAVAGNLLAVSATSGDAGAPNAGTVYLFNLSTGALLQTIVDPVGVLNDNFGFSLAMAGDLLVIGVPRHDAPGPVSDVGAIFIYNLRTKVLSGPILASAPEANAQYGRLVAVEGGLIAVGAPFEESGGTDRGAAYLVDAQTGAEIHRFTAADGANSDFFGRSVALARQRLLVGASNKNSSTGKVYAYDTVSFAEAWTSTGTVTDEAHGFSLAASGDLVVVGASRFDFPGADDAGRVQVLQSRGGNLVETLSAPGPVESDRFGTAVALSGATVLATATDRDNPLLGPNHGAAFKFFPIRSPLPFDEIAVKGSAPPAAPNTTFLTFNQLAISPGGFTTFDANVAGSGATLGKNSGIWTNGNPAALDVLQLVRRTGVPLNTTPVTARQGVNFTNPLSNVNGRLGFTATTRGTDITTLNDQVFVSWFPTGAGLTLPLEEGVTLIGGAPLRTFQPPRQLRGAGAGAGSFITQITRRLGGTVTAANDSGLQPFTAAGPESGVLEGASAASIGLGVKYGQFLPRVSVDQARGSFATFLQGGGTLSPVTAANNLAVFAFDESGGITTLGRKGDPAPNTQPGNFGTFSNFLAESNTGTASFFRASIIPPTGSSTRTQGLWSNRTGLVRAVLIKGDPPVSGLPAGVTIKSFVRFAPNINGALLAWVQLQGTGVTTANDGAILLSRIMSAEPNPVEILLREGFPAPGCGRARVAAIQALDAEINGTYVVLASLGVEAGGAALTDNQALFLANSTDGPDDELALRQPRLMLRKGMRFDRATSVAGGEIIKSIALPGFTADASGAMNTGLAHLVTVADPDGVGGPLGLLPMCSAVVTFNDGQTSVLSVFP